MRRLTVFCGAAVQVLDSDFEQCLCDACVTSQHEVMDTQRSKS